MLTDEEIDEIRFRIPTKAVTQRDHEVARAVERAAYAAAIKACEAFKCKHTGKLDDTIRGEAVLDCQRAILSLMQEQPK